MSKRKRSLSVEEDYYAECPFTISYETGHQRGNKHQKRKSDGQDENNQTRSQISPFKPKGSFKTHKNMDLEYTVELEYTGELECTAELEKGWRGMTRYRHFVYYGLSIYKKNKHDWVARILEIRASDKCHVYARIYWMYRPEELPLGTADGGKKVQGRQPYHGVNELIATNHRLATVDQWIESDTKEVPKELYWRQTFDFRNLQLSVCLIVSPSLSQD
ncbi:unnamed protein product [Fusarium fujikuroi]|nr:unnamed protein product [Fusarium fujikuroi]